MEIKIKYYRLIQEGHLFNLDKEVETTIKTNKQALDFNGKIGDKTGKKVWVSEGYSFQLESALKRIAFLELGDKDLKISLDEYVKMLVEEYRELKDLVNVFKQME
jgi:hypothetical protein